MLCFQLYNKTYEFEGVSSKQTYLGVVEQLITENDNYQQVARGNCGGVIMKVLALWCKSINQYIYIYILL